MEAALDDDAAVPDADDSVGVGSSVGEALDDDAMPDADDGSSAEDFDRDGAATRFSEGGIFFATVAAVVLVVATNSLLY